MAPGANVEAARRHLVPVPALERDPLTFSLVAFALMCVLLGVALRFVDLDARSYTNDEATTSIRSAGSSLRDWSALFDGHIRSVNELRRYQTLLPGRSTTDTVRALAIEDPQHPPLYYVLERWWIGAAGDGVAARRALSALFGVLALAAVFLLGAEAGRSWRCGAVCAALMAVSPFFISYSQHAREYALWALEVLVASWLLLRVLRVPSAKLWFGYAFVTALGLYTDLLYGAVLLSHGILVLAHTRTGGRGALIAWAASIMAALVAFAPWGFAVARGAGLLTNNAFLGAQLPPMIFAAKWLFNAALVFIDLEYRHPNAIVLVVPVLLTFAVAGYAAIRPPHFPGALVAGALIVPPTLAMIALDVLHHESRSTAARYLTPVWVGVVLLVGLALAAALSSRQTPTRVAGAVALAFLAAVGGVSTIAETRADWSWIDSSVAPIRPVAAMIDASPHSLVAYKSDRGGWDFKVMQLVNVLDGDVRFTLIAPDAPLVRPGGLHPTFLLDPSAAVLAEARRTGLRLAAAYREPEVAGEGLTANFRSRAAAARKRDNIADERTSLWRILP